jgi:iron complex outermembrane receptor protein
MDVAAAAPIVVVGTRSAEHNVPNTKVSVDSARLRATTNLRNTEDALRYFPSLFVRKRHIGDTQAPLATRTSGVGSSARSLVYADGVLLSALVGNNNNFASPRWGMVSPEEIERVDVLYGPFSAAYPGNAIGAVVNITTRMPEHLEATATAAVNLQGFDEYATRGHFPAYQLAATVGDRIGALSWFVSANHVDSKGQPLSFVTAARSSAGFPDVNRNRQPISVIGAGGLEHQRQNIFEANTTLDLPHDLQLTWRTGLFLNATDAHAQNYLGATTSAFSSQVYRFDERHWMHAATLKQTGDRLSWSLIGSLYDYAKDDQRLPSSGLPPSADGPGSIVRMNGTGWRTLDAKAAADLSAGQKISFGAHFDGFALKNRRFVAADWRSGAPGALIQEARGHTRTLALWAQDQFALAPALQLTLGARYEWWKAYGGRNFSASPALDVDQPSRTAHRLSPKASLRWQPAARWAVTLSAARALRFPTVSELYQAVSVGPVLTSPSPNLVPEKALSAELAIERATNSGRIRLSLFNESVRDALISQLAPLPGFDVPVNRVQNVDRTRTRGVELAIDRRNLLPRLDLSGSITLADPKTVSDPAFSKAEGKLIPQVPRRRATLLATWRPTDRLSLTGAVRYSSRMFGTIDNSDVVGHTYQGFEGYVVADVRAAYRLTPQIDVAAGVENLTDKRYFLFHPFPGRTFTAEVHWHL